MSTFLGFIDLGKALVKLSDIKAVQDLGEEGVEVALESGEKYKTPLTYSEVLSRIKEACAPQKPEPPRQAERAAPLVREGVQTPPPPKTVSKPSTGPKVIESLLMIKLSTQQKECFLLHLL